MAFSSMFKPHFLLPVLSPVLLPLSPGHRSSLFHVSPCCHHRCSLLLFSLPFSGVSLLLISTSSVQAAFPLHCWLTCFSPQFLSRNAALMLILFTDQSVFMGYALSISLNGLLCSFILLPFLLLLLYGFDFISSLSLKLCPCMSAAHCSLKIPHLLPFEST